MPIRLRSASYQRTAYRGSARCSGPARRGRAHDVSKPFGQFLAQPAGRYLQPPDGPGAVAATARFAAPEAPAGDAGPLGDAAPDGGGAASGEAVGEAGGGL